MATEGNCNCIVDNQCICNKNLCTCDCECVWCVVLEEADNEQNLCACGNGFCGCRNN